MIHAVKSKFLVHVCLVLLFASSQNAFSQSTDQSNRSDEFADNPWMGFDYQEMGLTQIEYQKVKESGMNREKLTHLLEIGIYPKEYFNQPWLKLGVDENVWLEERSEGLSDEDIDRSYDLATQGDQWAWSSLIIPSYYQWKTRQTHQALAINIWTLGTLGSWVSFKAQNFTKGRDTMLYLSLLGNLYSFLSGIIDNKQAIDPNIGLSLWRNEYSEHQVQINWRF